VNSSFVFIVSALALTALVVLILMWSLLRTRGAKTPNLAQANQQVYRQQLKDLEKEHAQGGLSQADFELARNELLGRMLEDTAQADAPDTIKPPRTLVSAMVLAVFLPVAAMSTYMWLGDVEGLNPSVAAAEEKDKHPDLEAMAASLAHKLESDSGNAQRWVMLGRTYRALSQYDKALPAYQKALTLGADDDIALERAEVLAQHNGGDFKGEPWAVIRQVLAKNARHFSGLLLAGSASYAQADFKNAIRYWQQARDQLDEGDEEIQGIEIALNKAREKAGEPMVASKPVLASPPSPHLASSASSASSAASSGTSGTSKTTSVGAGVSGRVSVDPALKASISPADVVFVYATPSDGQKMPLAILRKTAADLPFDFVLDDSTAMSPERKLSSQVQVVLKVRISKTGEAMTRPGDWIGMIDSVPVGAHNLRLVVNRQAP
jgi:cytochrome c-type biogenesis protein CcmH